MYIHFINKIILFLILSINISRSADLIVFDDANHKIYLAGFNDGFSLIAHHKNEGLKNSFLLSNQKSVLYEGESGIYSLNYLNKKVEKFNAPGTGRKGLKYKLLDDNNEVLVYSWNDVYENKAPQNAILKTSKVTGKKFYRKESVSVFQADNLKKKNRNVDKDEVFKLESINFKSSDRRAYPVKVINQDLYYYSFYNDKHYSFPSETYSNELIQKLVGSLLTKRITITANNRKATVFYLKPIENNDDKSRILLIYNKRNKKTYEFDFGAYQGMYSVSIKLLNNIVVVQYPPRTKRETSTKAFSYFIDVNDFKEYKLPIENKERVQAIYSKHKFIAAQKNKLKLIEVGPDYQEKRDIKVLEFPQGTFIGDVHIIGPKNFDYGRYEEDF